MVNKVRIRREQKLMHSRLDGLDCTAHCTSLHHLIHARCGMAKCNKCLPLRPRLAINIADVLTQTMPNGWSQMHCGCLTKKHPNAAYHFEAICTQMELQAPTWMCATITLCHIDWRKQPECVKQRLG